MIYDDLCYEHEADIFANQMKFAKNLAPFEIFVANLEAKNQEQLMIRDLVESYGLKISAKRAPGHICAGIHFGGYLLQIRIPGSQLCSSPDHRHMGGDSNSFSANIMKAVTKLCVVYKDQ